MMNYNLNYAKYHVNHTGIQTGTKVKYSINIKHIDGERRKEKKEE